MTTKVPGDKREKFKKGAKNLEESIIVKMLRERGIDTKDL
mgnify:CR=1 FL=1